MNKRYTLLVFLILCTTCRSRGKSAVLSRRKRYVLFPEGSSVSIAVCMTAQTGVIPPGVFTESIAWGLAYELPDNVTDYKELYTSSKYLLKRRNRRDLYGKMETIMNSFPDQRILSSEPDEHRIYHWAHQKGRETEDCSEVFPQCPFSLIDMALGHYSQFAD
ncbi:hypothetical protein NQ315_002956 [Exocentrus adspersus]|uniref:Uncharacterized protein n=1 Tax=Exocentrus adspersus TaxID=1586481 RepID=A0AAV8W5V4_9CUCU|nr:hypothetical protein NQ315_002956 [Exocentrus adspersus]